VIGIFFTDRSVGKGMPAFLKKASGRGVFFVFFLKLKLIDFVKTRLLAKIAVFFRGIRQGRKWLFLRRLGRSPQKSQKINPQLF
jgi:hypothetical protein